MIRYGFMWTILGGCGSINLHTLISLPLRRIIGFISIYQIQILLGGSLIIINLVGGKIIISKLMNLKMFGPILSLFSR